MKVVKRINMFTLEGRPPKVKKWCVNVPAILEPCSSRISNIRNAAATSHQHHSDVLNRTHSYLPNVALLKLIIIVFIITLFYAAIRNLV